MIATQIVTTLDAAGNRHEWTLRDSPLDLDEPARTERRALRRHRAMYGWAIGSDPRVVSRRWVTPGAAPTASTDHPHTKETA